LIAALTSVESGAADHSERNGADGGSEDTRSSANQNLGRNDGPKVWQQRDQQRPGSQGKDAGGDQGAFGSKAIHQRASRSLGEDAGDSAHGESQSNTLFVPLIARKIDGKERTDSSLDVGEKEIQPVETAQSSRLWQVALQTGYLVLGMFCGVAGPVDSRGDD